MYQHSAKDGGAEIAAFNPCKFTNAAPILEVAPVTSVVCPLSKILSPLRL